MYISSRVERVSGRPYLKISPSCQTLSKALDMSKKTLLTYNPLSKNVKILWIIDNSWLIQESPDWKPDWFFESKETGR